MATMWSLSVFALAAVTRGIALPQQRAGRYGFACSAPRTTLGTPMPSLVQLGIVNTAASPRPQLSLDLPDAAIEAQAAALATTSYVVQHDYEPDSAFVQTHIGPHPALTPACRAFSPGLNPPLACSILAALGPNPELDLGYGPGWWRATHWHDAAPRHSTARPPGVDLLAANGVHGILPYWIEGPAFIATIPLYILPWAVHLALDDEYVRWLTALRDYSAANKLLGALAPAWTREQLSAKPRDLRRREQRYEDFVRRCDELDVGPASIPLHRDRRHLLQSKRSAAGWRATGTLCGSGTGREHLCTTSTRLRIALPRGPTFGSFPACAGSISLPRAAPLDAASPRKATSAKLPATLRADAGPMHVHVVEHRLHWIVAALDWFDAAYLSSAFALANAVAMACRSLPLLHADDLAAAIAVVTLAAAHTARAALRQLVMAILDAVFDALEYALCVVAFAELIAHWAAILLMLATGSPP